MFIRYNVSFNKGWNYLIIDFDFEHTVVVSLNYQIDGLMPQDSARIQVFDAFMSVYEERGLNIGINSIHFFKFVEDYWRVSTVYLMQLLKEHSKIYNKYIDDIEKYIMLM